MIPDQKPLWDKKHLAGEHIKFQDKVSPFARKVAGIIKPNSQILELGCGTGRDSVFFAENGHSVTATDFSAVVIEQNKHRLADKNIKFSVLDMRRPFSYAPASFDAVYAYLSLHYFDDQTTKVVFKKISNVLKPGGILAFACKTTNDKTFGSGTEVEKNMFVANTGHARHLFSEEYVREVTNGLFKIEQIWEDEEEYWGEKSSILKCVAKKLT